MHKLVALHRHFLAADAIKQFLFVDVPVNAETSRLPSDLLAIGQAWSTILRLQVFYALLYVVIEGYRELGCQDAEVDRLVAKSDFVESFKRFRNANFHFQEDPFSPKILSFLEAPDSEDWAKQLYTALKNYFEKNLGITAFVDSLPKRDT